MANRVIQYFEQHYDELINPAVRMTKNYQDAEDIMQNVAYVLCKKDKELESVENCGAFIAVCIRRATISFFRHKSHEIITDPYYMELYQESIVTRETNRKDSEHDYLEWTLSLEKHLSEYPEELRKAFIAHYIDNVPLDVLGADLGLSVKALSGRFARMRKALKSKARSLFNQFNVLLLL